MVPTDSQTGRVVLESTRARVEVDLDAGGRLASLEVDGLELLVDAGRSALDWGCYPLAPWAGRIRNGVFAFEGEAYSLPRRAPPHAIHGTVFDRGWRLDSRDASACSLSIDLGRDWPWPGRVHQRIELRETELALQLELAAAREVFPASIGWHPWFRRQLARGAPARLAFEAAAVYRRDAQDIPTGETAPPGPGPYDDCFTRLVSAPVLCWPGALEVRLGSSLDHWVVYDEPEHALCVEPWSGPPDALNSAPRRVAPGDPLVGEFRLAWSTATV